MSMLSGKDGTLYLGTSEVTPVGHWKIEKSRQAKAYTANDTQGAKRRLAGVRDCFGQFELKATDAGNAPVEEGDAVTLELHIDNTGLNFYRVPAIIEAVRAEVDISEGRVIAYVVRFFGNGPVVSFGLVGKAES